MITRSQMRKLNPCWIVSKAYLWGRSYVRLSSDDVVMAFYPKTGSTWVRIFFYNLLTQCEEDSGEKFTFDDVNFSMPEFGNENFLKDWSFNCPCLVKTHRPYNSVFHRNEKVLLFVREPRDVMVSFLHYAKAKKELRFSGDLSDLVHHPEMGLKYYMKFVKSWEPRAKEIIKYEDLRGEPQMAFRRVVNAVGLDVTDDQIMQALESSSLSETRRAQEQSSQGFRTKFNEGFTFARKGSSGEGETQFDHALNGYYEQLRSEFNFNLYPL